MERLQMKKYEEDALIKKQIGERHRIERQNSDEYWLTFLSGFQGIFHNMYAIFTTFVEQWEHGSIEVKLRQSNLYK